jgi:hypothetical protein
MLFKSRTLLLATAMAGVVMLAAPTAALAGNSDPPRLGAKITPRSVCAGLLSFFIWPGIGQAVNTNKGEKVVTHAVLGLVPPFRFFSGWDGLVDRRGGYWDGRI